MDNYLLSRWPCEQEGLPTPLPPVPGRPRRIWRRLLTALGALIGVLLLGAIGYLGGWWLGHLTNPHPPADSASSDPSHSLRSDWTPEDLPWGRPDSGVQLSLAGTAGRALSASEIYDRVLPSVVYIESRRAHSYSGGTGIIVDTAGYVLTNYHIIDESTSIRVMLLRDRSEYYDARVIGYDEEYDLAVLKIEADGLTAAPLGDSDRLRVGDTVYAIGHPMGYLYGSMTEGIVSALDRDSLRSGMSMIQTSAALNQGNSGGPLLNDRGQVVGIVSAKISGMEDNTVVEGLGLAIPMSDLLPFANRILSSGRTWRPTIGIECEEAVQDGTHGVLVDSVEHSAPAYAAGLRPGDLIVEANGSPVTSLPTLRRVLYRTGVGGTVTCTALRGGREMEFSFPLIDSMAGQTGGSDGK